MASRSKRIFEMTKKLTKPDIRDQLIPQIITNVSTDGIDIDAWIQHGLNELEKARENNTEDNYYFEHDIIQGR